MKDNRYQKIIKHYGINNQLKKLTEEVYELQESILEQHNIEHILEEYADVEVILEQIKQYFKLDDEKIELIKDYKVARQLYRIRKENDE